MSQANKDETNSAAKNNNHSNHKKKDLLDEIVHETKERRHVKSKSRRKKITENNLIKISDSQHSNEHLEEKNFRFEYDEFFCHPILLFLHYFTA